jgi:protein-disulfide isomerase
MHDAIFENQRELGPPLLLDLAKKLRLSVADLQNSLSARLYASRVRDDFLGGVRSGVNGTPTFFINGRRHEGAFDFEDLVAAIDATEE